MNPGTASSLPFEGPSPIKHLEDNSHLVVYPEHPDLAETTEESGKGSLMPWGRKTSQAEVFWKNSPAPLRRKAHTEVEPPPVQKIRAFQYLQALVCALPMGLMSIPAQALASYLRV